MNEEDLIRSAMRSWNEGGFDAFAQHLAPAKEIWIFFDEAQTRAQAEL